MSIKVKICGLTNLADAQVACDAGADLLGFILYAKSPRYIAPGAAAEILATLQRPPHVLTVGVFVNMPVADVRAVLDQTGLDLAQLHGDEREDDLRALEGRAYKAIRPVDPAAARSAATFTQYPLPHAPQLMLDAYHPDAYGGTGQRADWKLAAGVATTTPRLLLAGGLAPDNVQAAIATVRPWGVDVASGVEAGPGRKDHHAVQRFIAAAKAASLAAP